MTNQYWRTLSIASLVIVVLAAPALARAAKIIFREAEPEVPATKTYLCIADKVVGFSQEDGEWDSTEWKAEGSEGARFLLKPNPNTEQAEDWPYVFHEFGDDLLKVGCSVRGWHDDQGHPYWYFTCGVNESGLHFATKSGRFVMHRIGSYIRGPESRYKIPAVLMIGTCDAVN